MNHSNGERFRPSAAVDGRQRPHSLATVAKDAAADLLDLVGAQIRLLKAELSAEARAALARLGRIALFAPILVGGYAFAMAALAAVLAPHWGWPLALVAVAALQLVAGACGIVWSLRRLARVRVLHRTADEMVETVRRIEATARTNEAAGRTDEAAGRTGQ